MIESFRQLINRLKGLAPQRACLAAAGDEAALQTVREALDEGVAAFTLVGHRDHIWRISCNIGLDLNRVEVVHDPEPHSALQTAVKLSAGGHADVLMNGGLESACFLDAVSGPVLSLLSAYEAPGFDRIIYITDGGLNACPDFDTKTQILKNAVDYLHSLGIETPRVAFLSANERVNPKMAVTVEAHKLAGMVREGLIPGALAGGPMALDVAVSREAARQKGIAGPVAGNADLLFVPDIEVGNTIGKIITHIARGKAASVVLGAGRPLVMAAKSESRPGRLYSLALACYPPARMSGFQIPARPQGGSL